MELDKRRYVVVEGPIGAGKTSLAHELAQRLHADVLLEQPEDNPFLSRFYDDMPRYALPAQLTFLFQRVGSRESRDAAACNRDPDHEVRLPFFGSRLADGIEREPDPAEYS